MKIDETFLSFIKYNVAYFKINMEINLMIFLQANIRKENSTIKFFIKTSNEPGGSSAGCPRTLKADLGGSL